MQVKTLEKGLALGKGSVTAGCYCHPGTPVCFYLRVGIGVYSGPGWAKKCGW